MPVTTEHPALVKAKPDIKRMRDTMAGERVIKESGSIYLPRLSNMTQKKYKEFLIHAAFQSITDDTLKEWRGLTFRSDPDYKLPFLPEGLVDNIDGEGNNLTAFTKTYFDCVSTYGRAGLMIVMEDDDPDGWPRLRLVETDNITNWPDKNQEGNFCVVRDKVPSPNVKDRYTHKEVDRHILMEINSDGHLIRTEHIKGKPSDKGEDMGAMANLPLVPTTIRGIDWGVNLIPLLSIANLNIRHYKLVSSLDWGLVQSQMPIMWARGYQNPEGGSPIGKDDILASDDEHFHFEIAEQRGYLIESLRNTIIDVERQLRYSGAATIEDSKRQVESSEALRIRQAAQHNRIIDIVYGCSVGMREALYRLAKMFPGGGLNIDKKEVEYEISRDLVDVRLSPEEVKQLLELAKEGKIDDETLAVALYEGEWMPKEFTIEELVKRAKETVASRKAEKTKTE